MNLRSFDGVQAMEAAPNPWPVRPDRGPRSGDPPATRTLIWSPGLLEQPG